MTSKKPARQQRKSLLMSEPAAIMTPRLLFILSVVCLCILGLVMVYSASSIAAYNEFGDATYYVKRQAVFLLAGVCLCAVMSRIPYPIWRNKALILVLWCFTVGLLALTAFGGGVSALGAERSIVIAGFALQPAEFAKITVLMTVAAIVQMRMDGEIGSRQFIAFVLGATIIPLILIYRQPDLGTAIILAVGIIALALLAGISAKIVVAIFLVVAIYIVVACVTQPYHFERIMTMFDPWADPQGKGYQAIQSLYAFGNGGLFGTGLGLSRQKYLYLPYAHTDFIYAIVGEELGLFGAVAVVLLFGLFIFAGMRISRNAPDLFGCMLAGSFTVMIGFQACVNMACVTGIAPVTGKALPFISYGGSSMIASLIMVGIVLSVSFRSKVGMAHERRRDNLRIIEGKSNENRSNRPHSPRAKKNDNVISFAGALREKRELHERGNEVRSRASCRQGRVGDEPRGCNACKTRVSKHRLSHQVNRPFAWEQPISMIEERAARPSSGSGETASGYASLKTKRRIRRA